MPLYVNSTEITDEQVFAEMQYHPASSAEQAQELAARALAIRELLIQEARRIGITPPENSAGEETIEDFLINRLLEQEVNTPEPDEVSCMRYYQQNQKIFVDAAGNPVPFQYVQTTIAEFLKDNSWQTAVKQYIKVLAGRAKIVGIQLESTDSPLVQ